MSSLRQPVPSRTEIFDFWRSQLRLEGERYGAAWSQLAEAVEEHWAALLAERGALFDRANRRLSESAEHYLATLRNMTDVITRGAQYFAGIPDGPGARERRLAYRYPVRMDLEYRLMDRGEIIRTGRGRTVNTSSNGILFESEEALPLQTVIQLYLDWPTGTSTGMTVALHLAGRTVRSQDNTTAVAIEWHEFRIGGGTQEGLSNPGGSSEPRQERTRARKGRRGSENGD